MERAAYDALGGHAAVRDAIAEDYEFARLLKRDGRFYARLVGAGDLVHTRMYRSLSEIWNGFTKNLYVGASHAPALGIAGAVWLAALSPLPEVLLLGAICRRRYAIAVRMFAVIAATAAAAEFGMRRSRFPRGSGAYFPLGAATMLAIFVNSIVRQRRGRIEWRGRTYAAERTTPPRSQT
jgi:chlorobactene glucosyltransferase